MMYNYIKKWKGDAKKMLLNFKMENFRSFKDETFFTMLSSKQKTHNDYAVSYTHLDVYKRQVITLICRSFASVRMEGRASPADRVPFMIKLLICIAICS